MGGKGVIGVEEKDEITCTEWEKGSICTVSKQNVKQDAGGRRSSS
jgi:hypothetical protein